MDRLQHLIAAAVDHWALAAPVVGGWGGLAWHHHRAPVRRWKR